MNQNNGRHNPLEALSQELGKMPPIQTPSMYAPAKAHPDVQQVMGGAIMEVCQKVTQEVTAMGLTAHEAGKAIDQECQDFARDMTERALQLRDRVAKFLDDVIETRAQVVAQRQQVLEPHLDNVPVITHPEQNGG